MEQYWNSMVPELVVTDFEKSLIFYTDVLNFKVRYSRKNPLFAYLENEQVQIMLQQIETSDKWSVGELIYPLGRGINFQIELSNIDLIYQNILDLDYALFEELNEIWYDSGNISYGQNQFLIQDLDGYLLRFSCSIGERKKFY